MIGLAFRIKCTLSALIVLVSATAALAQPSKRETGRLRLKADVVYYVNVSATKSAPCRTFICKPGKDSHNGRTPTAPFLTIQRAHDFIHHNVDLAGRQAVVVVADGVFSSNAIVIHINGPYTGASPQNPSYPFRQTCPVVFEGNPGAPDKVFLHTSNHNVILVTDGAYACFDGFTVKSTHRYGAGIHLGGSVIVLAGNIKFEGAGRSMIWSGNNSVFENFAPLYVQGSAQSVLEASFTSGVAIYRPIILSDDLNTTQFALASAGSVHIQAPVIAGPYKNHGKKYTVSNNGSITGVGGKKDFLPGTINGTIEAGSTYEGSHQSSKWTPTLSGTPTAGKFIYSVQSGSYEQNGDMVRLNASIATSQVVTSPSGAMQISGLPIPSANRPDKIGFCTASAFGHVGFSFGYTSLGGFIFPNTDVISLYESGPGVPQQPSPASGYTSTPQLFLTCDYYTQ